MFSGIVAAVGRINKLTPAKSAIACMSMPVHWALMALRWVIRLPTTASA
jgi:riboflavin synthase alpha subunit